jgi:hypothetical protein
LKVIKIRRCFINKLELTKDLDEHYDELIDDENEVFRAVAAKCINKMSELENKESIIEVKKAEKEML